ncbi:MAG: tetratricopeptide (TPR) repeat protein [Candidatus Paceibacteria bacterium]|jgi:tetratricopeptide (TPR) repeat protein
MIAKKSQSFALPRALSLTALAAATFALISAPASAVSAPALEKSEAEVNDEISFAKGLAKDWGFVDLASEVIKRIEKDGVKASTAERLGVVKCEIYGQGAIAERDHAKRNDLFEQALVAYGEFLQQNPNSSAAPEARSGFINISTTFAKALQISMEEAIGEEAETLRLRRSEVLLDANNLTRNLIDELQATFNSSDTPPESVKQDLAKAMMNRSLINLEIGKSSDDGTFSFEEARGILEDVVFLVGEGTPVALRAYDLIGQVYSAEQEWELASIYFAAVIDQALPADLKSWNTIVQEQELSQSHKEQRWLFLELSTKGLINALLSNGEVERATLYSMHLYNTQRREGFEYSTQMGYPSLLAAAKVLLDAGGMVVGRLNSGEGKWYASEDAAKADTGKTPSKRNSIGTADLALRIAQQVVSENSTNIMRVHGQKLIADITSRPGIDVDPEVLYEAAEGKYTEKEYIPAIEAFKRVLLSLEDKDQSLKVELGPKTFLRLARSYQFLDRNYEAAVAYREGCTTYAGDPEYDSYNATGYYKAMQELLRNAPGDALLQTMYEQAETIAAEMSKADGNQIQYDKGDRARRKKDYEEAITHFSQVQRAGIDYEKAVVYIAVCNYRLGKKDEAYASWVDYIENFVTNDLNSVSGGKEAKRQDAMATASFYRCYHEFGTRQYEKVCASSASYHKSFPDQTNFAPWVMSMVGNSFAKIEKIAEAKDMLAQLIDTFPASDFVAKLGIDLYKVLSKTRDAETKGTDSWKAATLEMATLMELGNKNASTPSFGNLRAESRHWVELSDWDKAVPVLEKIISKFDSDPEQEKQIAVYIKPDLAHGYLEQLKVAEAQAILSELMASLINKPSKRTVMNYTRSVLGWVQGSASDIREIPGAGQTAEDFQLATEKLNALGNSVSDKWVCGWYDLKFQLAYGYYRWGTAEGGPKDSKKTDSARSQLNALVQQLGSDFKGKNGVPGVDQSCEEAGDLEAELASDILRRRMVWLWGKLH